MNSPKLELGKSFMRIHFDKTESSIISYVKIARLKSFVYLQLERYISSNKRQENWVLYLAYKRLKTSY